MIDYSTLLNQRIQAVPPSAIRKFFDILEEMPDAISLGIGEPDFVTPWHIRDAGIYSLEKGNTMYTPNSGLPQLRKAISNYLRRRFAMDYSPDEVLVTVGGSEAIDLALRAFITPGDEVIIPEPCFVCYDPITQLCGGVPVPIATTAEDEFRLTAERLEAAITPRTKVLILPFPNNPTGAVMRREHLEPIAEVCVRRDLIVVSDEIYGELTYGGERFAFHAARHEGANDCRLRSLEKPCDDRLAAGICGCTGRGRQADDKNSPVRIDVRPDGEPVCRFGGGRKRRRRHSGNARTIRSAPPLYLRRSEPHRSALL